VSLLSLSLSLSRSCRFDTNADSDAAASEITAANSDITTTSINVAATDLSISQLNGGSASAVPTTVLSATAVAAALYILF
jgi:hypothetical protein